MRLVALVLVALTAVAAADDQKAAEKLFHAGEKAYKAQKFLQAAQDFEEAYKAFQAPELAFSAAQAYRRQYRLDPKHPEYVQKAVEYYQIYLSTQDGGTRVGDAADSLGEMLHELDRLGIAGKKQTSTEEKKTRLGVSVVFADRQAVELKAGGRMHEVDEEHDKDADKQPAVKAFVDGKEVELDALADVSAGDHLVRAEAPGYIPAQQTAHVVANDSRFAELTLQPMPAHVTVQTEDGAHVIVDGRTVGDAPRAPLDLAGGSHVITVVRTGRRPVARELIVTRDEKVTLPVELVPTTRRRAVPWVIGVGGVLVLGSAVSLLGANHYDTVAGDRLKDLNMGDQPQSVLDDYNRYRDRRDMLIDAAIISGSAAVAVGLTAAWLYYFDTPSAEGVKVVPFTGSDSGGAAISGRF